MTILQSKGTSTRKVKLTFSKAVIVLIAATWIYIGFNLNRWNDKNGVIQYDTTIYYEYLPALFIHGDPKFEFANEGFYPRVWLSDGPNNSRHPKMSLGLAVMYTPFFLAGHSYALMTDHNADGWSIPYQFALYWSGVFYTILASLFLRKLLKRYFSDIVTGCTILLLYFGTNLFYYSTTEPTMSHAYSFFLFSAGGWILEKMRTNLNSLSAVIFGLICGLAVLIRPTNIVIGIIPITLYCLKYRLSLLTRLKQDAGKISIMALFAFLVISIQLVFWKINSGNWVVYSYNDEGFFFSKPEIINGLLSYRKGWFTYTPLALVSLFGFIFLFRKFKHLSYSVMLFLIVNIYVVYSWWCWWYGGGFGSRAMIESTAILSLPLAALLSYIFEKQNQLWLRHIFFTFLFLVVSLNLFQTHQYRNGHLHYDGMDKESYWSVFGRLEPPGTYWGKIKRPDYESAMKGKEVYPIAKK